MWKSPKTPTAKGDDSVVEGGTGEIGKKIMENNAR